MGSSPKRSKRMLPNNVTAVTAFDMTQKPPKPSEHPKQVVILMRHGDRTPVREKFGELDLSHLAPKWRSLLPTEAEQAELDSVRVEREEGTGSNSYASFVGEGHLGQLTSLGFDQCRRAGQQLKARYPEARIRAFSTDFPRTIHTASCVLLGFGASEPPAVSVAAPERQTLLPNYDGRCRRYAALRQQLIEAAHAGVPTALEMMRRELEEMLLPVMGVEPMKKILDFTPFCVHQDVVGTFDGINWEMAKKIEKYKASVEAAAYANPELLRLAAGRLVQDVMDYLSQDGHQITLLAAHDNMMTAFLVALDVFKEQWPLYASMVLLETAELNGPRSVRVLMNDEVCLDWEPLETLRTRVSATVMSAAQYAAACDGIAGSTA
ncbi:unnamed protein product [Cladocopium goreaui]|uniref:Exportin-2 n=1 Tax=Cladocopium goreaui TaxID=2562237 RepID=A0A9P1GTX8_9DINO|nr:unnamed protein product [Cladocopium goreaui]